MPSHFGFRRRRSSGEDGAGWIYADLFLALTIVGLGSAIITSGVALSSGTPAVTTTTQPTFQLSCAEFGIKLPNQVMERGKAAIGRAIENGIAAEIKDRGWTEEQAKPGLVILAGGFGSDEQPGEGDKRAQAKVASVRSSTPLLNGVEVRTIGAQTLGVDGERFGVGGAGNYVLVVYLVYSGEKLEENCEK